MTRTPHCWNTDTAAFAETYPPLMGEAQADVCIVGAGITGLSAALALARRGFSVRVLEARVVGFGASGRAGGHLVPGVPGAPTAGLDPAIAKALWDLGNDAVATTRDVIAANGIDCDLHLTGHLRVAAKPRHVAALQALGKQADDAGLSLDWLDRSALESKLKSRAFAGALLDPRGGHLHPLKYTLGLVTAARAAGVEFYENTPYLGHGRKKDGLIEVQAPRGVVRARWLLLAGGAFLWERKQSPNRVAVPVNTFVAATDPLDPDLVAGLIPGNEGVVDTALVPHHLRRTPDHRLVIGGIATYATIDPFNMRYPLRDKLKEIFPSLPKEMRISHAWGGPEAVTRSRLPHFGRIGQNILVAHGFSGQGLALAGQAGLLLAGAVAQTEERFDILARLPHAAVPGARISPVPAILWEMARLWFLEAKADYQYRRAQRAGN